MTVHHETAKPYKITGADVILNVKHMQLFV